MYNDNNSLKYSIINFHFYNLSQNSQNKIQSFLILVEDQYFGLVKLISHFKKNYADTQNIEYIIAN